MQHNATHKHTQKKAEYIITKKHQHNHHHHQTKTQTQTQVNMQALHVKKDNPQKKIEKENRKVSYFAVCLVLKNNNTYYYYYYYYYYFVRDSNTRSWFTDGG